MLASSERMDRASFLHSLSTRQETDAVCTPPGVLKISAEEGAHSEAWVGLRKPLGMARGPGPSSSMENEGPRGGHNMTEPDSELRPGCRGEVPCAPLFLTLPPPRGASRH